MKSRSLAKQASPFRAVVLLVCIIAYLGAVAEARSTKPKPTRSPRRRLGNDHRP